MIDECQNRTSFSKFINDNSNQQTNFFDLKTNTLTQWYCEA